MNATGKARLWRKAKKPVMGVVIVGALVLLAGAFRSFWGDVSGSGQPFVFYTVNRSDLPIVVTERGSLESQMQTKIRCDVENMTYDRSGNAGTQIIFIVPNGSAVKKDELLVELDSAAIRDRLDQQVLDSQRAKSQRIQAVARFENQKIQNKISKAQAQLQVELADLTLLKYIDPDSGDYVLNRDDLERLIAESKSTILEMRAALELGKVDKAGIESLFQLGYRGKSDLDQSLFRYLQAEDKLASSMRQLSTHKASLKQLDVYELKMRKKELEGEVSTAKGNLTQVITDNGSQLEQAEAAKDEGIQAEQKENERLAKFETQLELCKILAPHDGMVVYAREGRRGSSGTEIAEGVSVRQRQEIITLPDLSMMQVKTQIHEAVLDQVRPGLPTTVRIDAFPNRTYTGVVHQVAVVPTNNWGSNVTTYDCLVRIVDEVEQLKPGMTAVVDIHVARIKDVLAVPIQAIVQVERETWCYTQSSHGVERLDVELGPNNDKFVQVVNGLDAGARIVLNPMLIFEESKVDNNAISPDAGATDAPEIPDAGPIAQNVSSSGTAAPPVGGGRRGAPPQGRPGGGRPAGTARPAAGGQGGPGPGGRPTAGAQAANAAAPAAAR